MIKSKSKCVLEIFRFWYNKKYINFLMVVFRQILSKKLNQGDLKLKKVNKVLPPGSTNVFTGKPLNTGSNEKSSESNSSSPVKPQSAGTSTSIVTKPKSTEGPLALNPKEV